MKAVRIHRYGDESVLTLDDAPLPVIGDDDVLIRVGTQDGGENAEQTVIDKVRGELQDQYDFRRVEVVGPTVSGELAKQGTIAMLVALLGILVYVVSGIMRVPAGAVFRAVLPLLGVLLAALMVLSLGMAAWPALAPRLSGLF